MHLPDLQLCWEQARNLLSLKPQFEASGYKLAVVAIGEWLCYVRGMVCYACCAVLC